MTALPRPPKGRLAEVLNEIQVKRPTALEPVVEHLLGGTSADWLAGALSNNGHPIGATTIKSYRRDLAASTERSV